MSGIALAVIGMPHVAAALTEAGRAPDASGGPAEVDAYLTTCATPVVLVVGDVVLPGLRGWVERTAAVRPTLIVRTAPSAGIGAPRARPVDLPVTLDELLALTRQAPVGGDHGARVINADGTVDAVPVSEPKGAWVDDPWAAFGMDDPATDGPVPPAGAGVVEPAGWDAAPWEAPGPDERAGVAPGVADDLWGCTEVAVPAPVPALAGRVADAPVPSQPAGWAAPAPVAPVAPAGWGAPTESVPNPRPAPVAPVAPAGWGAPAPAPAPVPAPVPVPAHIATPAVMMPGADMFSTRATAAPAPQTHRGRGQVVVVISAKGGVAKSGTSRGLAYLAARTPNPVTGAPLRVCLVDANIGQPDQRNWLRLDEDGPRPVRSLYDVACGAAPESAILSPAEINAMRDARAEQVAFAAVVPPAIEDSGLNTGQMSLITPAVLRSVIDAAAATHDLVIVDTQVAESRQADDPATMLGGCVMPLLRADTAWALCVSDMSTDSTNDNSWLLERMVEAGAPRSSLLVAMTRTYDGLREDAARGHWGTYATWMGAVTQSDEVAALLTQGVVPVDHDAYRGVLNAVLYQVLRMDAFAPPDPAAAPRRKRRFGLF